MSSPSPGWYGGWYGEWHGDWFGSGDILPDSLLVPVNYPVLGYGDYGAIPNLVADYADGPEVLGIPDWPERYRTRWIAWKAADGVRLAQWTPGFVPTDSNGSRVDNLFNGDTNFTELSLAWDQNGRPAVAVQRPGNLIELRKRQADLLTSFSWPGRCPQLFYNGLLEYRVPLTDVMCLYLPAVDGDRILARVQRENYGVEHTMNPTLGVTLSRLTKVDRIGSQTVIWGITTGATRKDRSQVYYQSDVYPAWPELFSDGAAQHLELLGGEYMLVAVSTGTLAEASWTQMSLVSGTYQFSIITQESGDAAGLYVGLADGSYALAIISSPPDHDVADVEVGLDYGEYVLLVGGISAHSEKATVHLELVSGTYTAV
jgi:hypothetical protein